MYAHARAYVLHVIDLLVYTHLPVPLCQVPFLLSVT